MTKRMTAIVSGLALGAGILIGGLCMGRVEAQSRRTRFDIQRETDFIFIRNPDNGDCFLAVIGGGIISVRCN
jgi:riboflavin synthase alpha subunit